MTILIQASRIKAELTYPADNNYLLTSARTGENVETAFMRLSEFIMESMFLVLKNNKKRWGDEFYSLSGPRGFHAPDQHFLPGLVLIRV